MINIQEDVPVGTYELEVTLKDANIVLRETRYKLTVTVKDVEDNDNASDYDSLLDFFRQLIVTQDRMFDAAPVMFVESMTAAGLLTLGVDMPMHVPPWPQVDDKFEIEVI